MRRPLGSRSSAALSLLAGLVLIAPGCGGQAEGDAAKSAEVQQATRNKWQQAKSDGTANQVKGQPAPAGGSSSSRARYSRH